jgi:hypothetical protein
MATRFYYFVHVYLPSIVAQTEKNFMVVLLYSPNMPYTYLQSLKTIVYPYRDFIHLLKTGPSDDFSLNSHYSNIVPLTTKRIATVLLDDDDALHSSFVKRVYELMYKTSKTTISYFSRGCTVDLVNKKAIIIESKNTFVSAGLTFIFDWGTELHNVYHKKNTYQLDRPLKIIRISDTPSLMFLMSNHDTNHSLRGGWMKMTHNIGIDVLNSFPFINRDINHDVE